MMTIRKLPESNNVHGYRSYRHLTNFDPSRLPIYEAAVARYERENVHAVGRLSLRAGLSDGVLYVKVGEVDTRRPVNDALPSVDLSEFWRILRVIECQPDMITLLPYKHQRDATLGNAMFECAEKPEQHKELLTNIALSMRKLGLKTVRDIHPNVDIYNEEFQELHVKAGKMLQAEWLRLDTEGCNVG